MFQKILIANRAEIACRVIDTARRLGVATVAVYSDADAGARHVAMADQAVHIGGPRPADSYLRGDAIIAAALSTGAQAIHPGYGFLSENPDFVDAVQAAGLVFIGPSGDAIRAMGLKDAAKALMARAGVPVVPGYHGDNQDPEHLAGAAEALGYPVLIKAVAGGGGKGMRRVDRAADFAAALSGAQGEAQTAFGNPSVLIEKYVEKPRHIEVQIFGDGTRAVHLFERDCSLQRRHQKVIEEAPAPGMTEEMRAAMGQAAVRAAEAIGYSGAGTVEFITDASDGLRPDRFWFMEMNTRLQVEHPVTEAITGVDLVEWQLRVASGEPLPARQEDLQISGHAFEARLYAEDVPAGFLPATGTLKHLRFPPGLRVETGVRPGDTISPWYDPMIAKVISHGRRLGHFHRRRRRRGRNGPTQRGAFLGRHRRFRLGQTAGRPADQPCQDQRRDHPGDRRHPDPHRTQKPKCKENRGSEPTTQLAGFRLAVCVVRRHFAFPFPLSVPGGGRHAVPASVGCRSSLQISIPSSVIVCLRPFEETVKPFLDDDLRLNHPAVATGAPRKALQIAVHPGNFARAPGGDLVEMEDAQIVQKRLERRSDALDLLQLIGLAVAGCNQRKRFLRSGFSRLCGFPRRPGHRCSRG